MPDQNFDFCSHNANNAKINTVCMRYIMSVYLPLMQLIMCMCDVCVSQLDNSNVGKVMF